MTRAAEPQKPTSAGEPEKPVKINPDGEIIVDGGQVVSAEIVSPGAPTAQAGSPIFPPNQYHLRKGAVRILYDPTGAGSAETADPTILRYQDDQRSVDFHPDEVRYVDVPDVGTFVSATLEAGETGSTTAALLLPDVSLRPGESTPVEAILITRTHDSGVGEPGERHGDSFTVAELSGNASSEPLTQEAVINAPSHEATAG